MKTKLFLIYFSILGFVSSVHAQKASEGKAVVAHGFENSNHIRFGVLRTYDVSQWLWDAGRYAYGDSLIDTLGANLSEDWYTASDKKIFSSNELAICAGGALDSAFGPNLTDFGHTIFQRIYPPFPVPLHHAFRYNDIVFDTMPGVKTQVYNNSYDSEDISPYAQYPANPAFVSQTFHTRRFSNVDSVVYYGNEGRVILGYSDDRNGNDLLTTPTGYPFRSRLGLDDTAKAFSVNLEFSLDTSNINMMDAPNPTDTDHVPLVRLQVLYKDSGQTVLPFVPFTNGSDANHGWFKCLDTAITRASYRTLDTDWRAPDSSFNGSVGHNAHSWVFKQFHAMIALSDSMKSGMKRNVYSPTDGDGIPGDARTMLEYKYGWASNSANVLDSTFTNPDSIVAYDTAILENKNRLFEIRVLSTYRTTVRVRDVTYQDTMVDRFLYRKRVGDSTHSLEQSGAIGGNDSLMNATLAIWHTMLGANLPRELMYNDNGLPLAGVPSMGYLEWLGSKYQIYVHMRPQDYGAWALAWRRARMSLDGQPPSIFENQEGQYYPDMIPLDYLFYGHKIDTSVAWDTTTGHTSLLDKLTNMWVGRAGKYDPEGTDSLAAYKCFTDNMMIGAHTFQGIRLMSRVGQWHPWSKRFATEYSLKTFSTYINGATLDAHGHVKFSGYYDSTLGVWINSGDGWPNPALTPEMITAIIYGSLANGATAYSAAEALGNAGGDWGDHDFGVFAPAPRDTTQESSAAVRYTHDYNVGHYYGCRERPWSSPDLSDQDSALQPYYLGLSNTYRAYQLATGRMNAIWNAGPHPMKNFRWLDAYSQYYTWSPTRRDTIPNAPDRIINPMLDSLSKTNAFIKVVRTQHVKPWQYGPQGEYLDTAWYDDTTTETVEVGLFLDSINSSTKNYSALIVNSHYWPCRDSATLAYYNTGLDSISKIHPTLGDIDVRKVYLKLDLTKTNTTFSNHIYYVVRDLWHQDSTWLLNKDSTFAVYIKPGDAKFLYFEPGIAVNVAARTGTDTGESTQAEFNFNNGRRVVEILHETHDVTTYTRNHHVYVSYPAAGSTFGESPDESSGDNIITGYEQAIDTAHFCARPSIAVAMNDTGVALTYWDSTGTGQIVAAYRKAPDSAWQIVRFDTIYPDTSLDYHMITPVITPIDDTSWLIAAGRHRVVPGGPVGIIYGQVFVTPAGRVAYAGPVYPLWNDITRPDGSIAQALFPTLASRPMWGPPWNVHLAWQQDTIAGRNQIYFRRFANLPSSIAPAPVEYISIGLGACDNIHPSLALGGTYEYAGWLLPGFALGYDTFYHDQLAWETMSGWISTEFPIGGGSYMPVLRARHEGFSPTVYPGSWGAYSVFMTAGSNHYPQPSAEDRRWDYKFASPSDTSHDWIRLLYQDGNYLQCECWTPNWYHFTLNENGNEPSIPQSTGDFGPWPDSGAVGRSICWTATGSDPHVRVTNGYMPRIKGKPVGFSPNAVVITGGLSCDTIVIVGYGPPRLVPPTGPPVPVDWNAPSPSLSGPAASWTNPEQIPNVMTSATFAVQACDSVIVPRHGIVTGLTLIQDSLRSSSDYVTVRLLLRRAVDSSWYGTVDSMIVTRSSIHWPGVTPGIEPDTTRYGVSCGASTDSVFLSMDVERGDTTNAIQRAYVMVMDTDSTAQPAEKRAEHPTVAQVDTGGLQVTVHPNPVRAMVEICVEDLPEGVPASAIIVNQAGETVATLYNATPEGELGLCMKLDCSNLPSGTYYAYVQNAIMGTAVKFQVIK